jgi:hypothetical protein
VTSIATKASQLLTSQSHVILVSETAATAYAQNVIGGQLRRAFNPVWGPPQLW